MTVRVLSLLRKLVMKGRKRCPPLFLIGVID